MFLTKIRLDARLRCVRRCFSDCQAMHSKLMAFFGCTREDAGVLYRFDADRLMVYVISRKAPDLSCKNDGFTIVACRNIDFFLGRLKNGNVFRFNVKVCPSRQNSGKRSFIRDFDGRNDWLCRFGGKHGFSVLSVDHPGVEKMYGYHSKEKGGRIFYPNVVFQGTLRVTDVEKFVSVYCNGVGRGLSYGLGMLLLS